MPDLVLHDLLDVAGSLAISAGAPIKAAQRVLGHASTKVTLDIYCEVFKHDSKHLLTGSRSATEKLPSPTNRP